MGLIIVIEGTDGCGKQTQTKLLYDKLIARGVNVVKQSFPNYDSISSGCVKMYLNGDFGNNANSLDAYQASVLYAADRLCTYNNLSSYINNNTICLKSHYDNGGVIIFDRYVTSNLLHQAGKIQDLQEKNIFIHWLEDLEYGNLKLPKPDLIFFLDVPVEYSNKLAKNREALKNGTNSDILEDDIVHLKNAYDSGKYVANKQSWNIVDCIDTNGNLMSAESISNIIFACALEKINKII